MLTDEALNTLKKEYHDEKQTQAQIAQRRNTKQQTIQRMINGTCKIGNMKVSTFQKIFPYSTINEGGNTNTINNQNSRVSGLQLAVGGNVSSIQSNSTKNEASFVEAVRKILKKESFSDSEKLKFIEFKLEELEGD